MLRTGGLRAAGTEDTPGTGNRRSPENNTASPETMGTIRWGITPEQKEQSGGSGWAPEGCEGAREVSDTACHHVTHPTRGRQGILTKKPRDTEAANCCDIPTPLWHTHVIRSKHGEKGGDQARGVRKSASQITVSTKCPFLSRLDGYSIFSSNACLLKW